MRISDGSLDVVSSELQAHAGGAVDRACVDQAAARGDRDDARLVQPAAIAGVDVGAVALAVGDEFAPVELRRADLEAQLWGQFDVSREICGAYSGASVGRYGKNMGVGEYLKKNHTIKN